MKSLLFICSTLTTAALVALTGQAAAQSYALTDLGNGQARAINDSGQIVGTNLSGDAMLWDGSSATQLDKTGRRNIATGIDDSGLVVGFYNATPFCLPKYKAVLWNNNIPETLSSVPDKYSEANGINNDGAVTGFIYAGKHPEQKQAVLWDGGKVILLGSAAGYSYSDANAINNSGQEAGYVYQNYGSAVGQAVLWSGTSVTLLDTLNSNSSTEATALNNNGQEAGYSNDAINHLRQAVLWNGTTVQALATLGGTNSAAFGINNAGEVVGYSYTKGNNSKQAVLWENGKIINLNSFLNPAEIKQGLVLENATAINSDGTIVGVAENIFTGKEQAFALNLISAVPEVESYLMFLSGLGLIGFVGSWRNRSSWLVVRNGGRG